MSSFVNIPATRLRVRVWDVVVRLFHWSLVGMVTAAYIFDSPRGLHRSLGYVVIAPITFRVVWGFVGTRHARFSDFVTSPRRLFRYLVDLLRGREARFQGHNPAGGVMILALLTTLAAIGMTGYMMGRDAYFGVEWVEDAHEAFVTCLLVPLHVVGVVGSSLRHRENLVLSMITGQKVEDGHDTHS